MSRCFGAPCGVAEVCETTLLSENFEAPDPAGIMFKVTRGQPEPLSEVVPGCPLQLEAIVMRALTKDRELRYQSLEDLLVDLHDKSAVPQFRKFQLDPNVNPTVKKRVDWGIQQLN